MSIKVRFYIIITVVIIGLVAILSLNSYLIFRITVLNNVQSSCDTAISALNRLQYLTSELLSTETLDDTYNKWNDGYSDLHQTITALKHSEEIHSIISEQDRLRTIDAMNHLWNSASKKLNRVKNDLSLFLEFENPSMDGILLQYYIKKDRQTFFIRNNIYDANEYLTTDFETRFNEIVNIVQNKTKQQISVTVIQAMLLSAAIILPILLILIPFLMKLKRNLGDIHRSMTRLGQGDFSIQLTIPGQDELTDIAQAINLTTQNLEMKQKELQTINEQLEDLVEERTSEIKQTVEKLEEEVEIREKNEEVIVKQRAEFEAIFNSITDGVVFVDVNRHIILVNPGFTKIMGYQPEEVIGKTTSYFYAGVDDFEKFGEKIYHNTSDTMQQLYEIEFQRKNGTTFPSETLGAHVRNQNDEVIGFIGIVRDITQRKKARKEKEDLEVKLRQAQKMEAIGTLTGGIAHDFNNILSSVIGYAEMVIETAADKPELMEMVEPILQAGLRAKDLVQQILTVSRQSSQNLQPVKIQIVLIEVLKLLRSTIPTTIKIEHVFDPDCPAVLADSTQIHQVIMNLCTNAHYAMRENGGELSISLECTKTEHPSPKHKSEQETTRFAKIEIRDTGVGINQETMDRIFDPYFTTKPVGEGTGLGLSVVQGIVTTFGGDIQVTSKPGAGTTFTVLLPTITRRKETSEVKPDIAIPGGQERILFVDDDENIARLSQISLAKLGYKVDAFTISTEALESIQKSPESFDLVITDMTMPNMTGLSLSQRTLKIRPDIPIILCTGFSDMVTQEKIMAIGIRKLLMKPIVHRELAKAIRQVLDESKKTDAH